MPPRPIAAPCLTLLVAACSMPVPIEPPGNAIVYVVDLGWRTDIALPVAEIAGPLASLEVEIPGVRVLTFGFGERQFLVARQKNLAGRRSVSRQRVCRSRYL